MSELQADKILGLWRKISPFFRGLLDGAFEKMLFALENQESLYPDAPAERWERSPRDWDVAGSNSSRANPKGIKIGIGCFLAQHSALRG